MSEATFSIRNGPTFKGVSFGADKPAAGEAVFTTSLVGYPESMSDPSYCGQILVFTQPLIGNYGVPSTEARDHFDLLRFFESPHAHVVGIVVAEYAYEHSHWTAVESLASWCKREGVAAITGVDTREAVQYLREQGSSLGRITVQGHEEADWADPMAINLVAKVTTKQPYHVKALQPRCNVALIDCGVKENIVRCLVARGANVTVLPADFRIQDVAQQFDGVFVSNGPGNPSFCSVTVANLKALLEDEKLSKLPIFGICMGHQLLALASGARTHKLKYGNRAHNIPAMDLTTGQCHITSQNHGYAVDAETLSEDWKPYFINLNDQSNEGMIHTKRPIFTTQFHPEAKGGPTDSSVLFDKYFDNIDQYLAYKQSNSKLSSFPAVLQVDELPAQRVA